MQLVMRRDLTAPLPDPPVLPRGYEIRAAEDEDAVEIGRVLARSFGEPWPLDQVFGKLLHAPDVRRTYIVEFGRTVAATASCQVLPDRWPGAGLVHWVAADPTHSGRGLGYAITLEVLRDHQGEGHPEAFLTTDDERLPAIVTYLKLGFHPHLCDPTHSERWNRIREQLGRQL